MIDTVISLRGTPRQLLRPQAHTLFSHLFKLSVGDQPILVLVILLRRNNTDTHNSQMLLTDTTSGQRYCSQIAFTDTAHQYSSLVLTEIAFTSR